MYHSDRGSQDAFKAYRDELSARGLEGSMGRHDDPRDTAKAESFMKTLKVEAVDPVGVDDVADYPPRFIEDVYKGLHSARGYLSLKPFEDRFTRQPVRSAA